MAAHCCQRMQEAVDYVCDQHPDRFDCPDCLIYHGPRSQEFGLIIHDGGGSFVRIRFCPWCGKELPQRPESRQDELFGGDYNPEPPSCLPPTSST